MKSEIINERKKLIASIERLMEVPMIFLGFVWLVLLIIDLIWSLPRWLDYLSISIWVLFIIDFVVKFLLAPEKLLYLKKNVLTAISLIIPALRVFRVFRIVRVLRGLRGVRLVRVVSSINRGMKSLAATMSRRAFAYVFFLALVVAFAGAAGMHAIERDTPGFETYGLALWWTAMRIITAGSEHFPITSEGRGLAFLLALFGYAIFGYVTATLASFFIGRDAEESEGPLAGSEEIKELRKEVANLTVLISGMANNQANKQEGNQ